MKGTVFYKPDEVAKILGVSRDAVMQLIKGRELSAVRLSRSTFRVMDHQLADFQQGRKA